MGKQSIYRLRSKQWTLYEYAEKQRRGRPGDYAAKEIKINE